MKRGYATSDLLSRMAEALAVCAHITPRQMAAFDCWHRLYGYPADRAARDGQ